MPDNPMPVSKSRLLASVSPELPGTKDIGLLTVELGLVVLEPELPDVLLGGMGTAVPTEPPEPPELPELEPLEELFPPSALVGGVMFLVAFFASAANDVWVRDWFIAGLVRTLGLKEASIMRCKLTDLSRRPCHLGNDFPASNSTIWASCR